MLKNISNLGTVLSKTEQQSINGGGEGGSQGAYYCIIYTYSDLVHCQELGGEIGYCAPHIECVSEN